MNTEKDIEAARNYTSGKFDGWVLSARGHIDVQNCFLAGISHAREESDEREKVLLEAVKFSANSGNDELSVLKFMEKTLAKYEQLKKDSK